MWLVLFYIFSLNLCVQSMELKSINSCQTPLIPTLDRLCPFSTSFDAELYIYHSFSNLTFLTFFNLSSIDDYIHLEYTRNDHLHPETLWRSYRFLNAKDSHLQLNPPIIARHLRIKTNLCLQLQIFGCTFTDGVISYNMLQGSNHFEDDTYDGFYNEKHRYLYDGLGQLSDGQTGPDNYEDERGLQWVGWRKSRRSNSSLSILFTFDSLRNFSRLTVHINNYYPKKIYVFRSIQIEFVHENSSTFLSSHHQRDDQFEMARPIMINLQYHLASQIKIHFEFDGHWLLLSECTFDSQILPIHSIAHLSSTNPYSIYFLLCLSLLFMILLTPIFIWFSYRIMSHRRSKTDSFLPIHSSLSTTSSDFDSHQYASITSSYEKFLSTTNFLRMPKNHFEGVCGNSAYATQRTLSMNLDPKLFLSYEQIRMKKKIENRYQSLGGGEIYQGELQTHESSIPITVRRLAANASNESKVSFLNEISLLTSLCHPHLLHAYGLCSEPSLSLLIESSNSSTMDLYQYLQHYKQEQIDDQRSFLSIVGFFALQICSALTYLESVHIYHRDLATRNCLLSANLHIKLQDLAMTNEVYADDYVLITLENDIKTRRPLRWCAWETICFNRFTSKSDVFSFGVLLWEILTLADRPHGLLTDEEVLSNLRNRSHYLPVPVYAGDLGELLLSCWNPTDFHRPTFSFIHQYLTEKINRL